MPAPAAASTPARASSRGPLRAERVAFDTIDPDTWDTLAALNPYATPFSRWAFQRAWWDAYRGNAEPDTMVIVDPSSPTPDRPIGIAPLMHRHAVEAADATTHTTIRHAAVANLTPVPPTACAIYFGASYHADYATLLAAPADLPRVADAIADALSTEKLATLSFHNEPASAAKPATDAAGSAPPGSADAADHAEPWNVVDLRRLRSVDPAFDALAAAFSGREMAEGWTLNVEREDVCPVIRIPEGADLDAFLATLGKKERHEIRRKVRRAEAAGPVELVESTDPLADLEAFIDLHQARWGADGLFPATPGGDQSRTFFRRLFELFGDRARAAAPAPVSTGAPIPGGVTPGAASAPPATGSRPPTIHLSFLTVAGRRIAAAVHFETPGALLYYNAGVAPDARDLSPGVVLLERLVRRAIERGKCRVDLLRGDEPYKYEWGAVDEPVQRILVRRTA